MEMKKTELQISFVGVLVFMGLVYFGSLLTLLTVKFLFPFIGLTFPAKIFPFGVKIAYVSAIVYAISVITIPVMAMFNEERKSRVLNELILVGLGIYTISTIITSYFVLHLTY